MKRAVVLRYLLLSLLVFLTPWTAYGQLLHLGQLKGDLKLEGDFANRTTVVDGEVTNSIENLLLQQRFSIRTINAAIIDPRLLNFSLGTNFGFSEFFQSEIDEIPISTLWGYDVFVGILPQEPVALNLFASRNQYYQSRDLVGLSVIEAENRGFGLALRRLFIPSNITYRNTFQCSTPLEQGYTVDGTTDTSSTDVSTSDYTKSCGGAEPDSSKQGTRERQKILTYDGKRGWVDSEMNLRYEFIELTNELFDELSYRNHEGGLYYSIDLGDELNWRWDSRLTASTRTGGTLELTTVILDELMQATHSEHFHTEYRYNFNYNRTDGGATSTHTGYANLRHRLYEAFTSTAIGDAVLQDLTDGRKKGIRGSVGTIYAKRLPHNGHFTLGLGGGLQYESDNFTSSQSYISQEPHTAEPSLAPIVLYNKDVIESSIVVTKTKVSQDFPSECEPSTVPEILLEGRDYEIQTVGSVTEIVPIACSATASGINPGDSIVVDYNFQGSSRSFYTKNLHAEIGLGYEWLRVILSHEQSDQELISGSNEDFLEDQYSERLGVELNWSNDFLRAKISGDARQTSSNRLVSRSLQGNQLIDLRLHSTLSLSLSADQRINRYDYIDDLESATIEPDRVSRILSARMAATWAAGRGLLLDGFGRIWWLDSSNVSTQASEEPSQNADTLSERSIEASFRVRWLFRKLELNSVLTYASRLRDSSRPNEFRANVQIIRFLF